MVRPRPADRLPVLVEAAIRVFSSRGYHRTQMADVAREMGVAAGTLYGYVESKEALFLLLLEHGFREAEGVVVPPALPVSAPPPAELLARLRERLAEGARLASLEAALGRRRPGEPRAEIRGIVGELYDRMARHRRAIVLLERSAADWPELAELYYREMRRGLLERLERWIVRGAQAGRLRRVPHPAAAARLVNETVAWFALHRHGDRDSSSISDEAARETVLDALVHALVAPERDASPGG